MENPIIEKFLDQLERSKNHEKKITEDSFIFWAVNIRDKSGVRLFSNGDITAGLKSIFGLSISPDAVQKRYTRLNETIGKAR